jgi:hypothetical protein
MKPRRAWPWIGIAGQVVFTLFWLIAPAWQGPRYSVLAHSISDLYAVTAPYCRVIVVVVTVCGIATILFAGFGLFPAVRRVGWTGWLGTALLALSIFGLGDLLTPFEQEGCRTADAGCTAADQLSAGGATDAFLSTVGIALLIAAGAFLFVALRRTAAPRWLSNLVLILAIATFVVFGVDAVGIAGYGGLLERLLALFGAAMITVLSVATISLARRTESASGVTT